MAMKMNEANKKKVLNSMLLGEDELFEFFSNFFPKLRITMQDLKVPKANTVRSMYEAFLADFGVSLHHLPQSLMMAGGNEMSDDNAIFICNYFAVLDNALSCTQYEDLQIRDLTDPKPKRTRLILSLLKNYWEYIYHRYGNYLSIKDSLDKDSESLREHYSKMEALKKKINTIKLREAEKEPQIKQYKSSNMQLKQEIASKCQIKSNILTELDKKKSDMANFKAQLAKQNSERSELQKKDEELLRKISSENDTKVSEELSQKEVAANATKEESKNKVIKAKKFLERTKKMKADLTSALVVMRDRKQDLEKYKELELPLESYHKILNDEKNKKETQFNELKRYKRLLTIKEDSVAKSRIQNSRKLTAMTENTEQLKKDLFALEQQHNQFSDVENQQVSTLNEIEKKIKLDENALEEMKKQLQKRYAMLLQKVDDWHSTVLEDLSNKNELMLENL